jgi:hypothetical protein
VYTYVRISGLGGLAVNTAIKVNIMGLKVPSVANRIYPINIRVADAVGSFYEYYGIQNAIYTLTAYVGTATAQTTASMTPLTTSSTTNLQYQLSTSAAQATLTQSTVLFRYNQDLWSEVWNTFQATVDGVAATIDPLDAGSSFITFPADIATATSVSINVIAGLRNPLYSGAFTSNCELLWLDYQHGKVQRHVSATISETLTLATVFAIKGTPEIDQSSSFLSDTGTVLYIYFTLNENMKIGTAFEVVLPAAFALQATAFCQLTTLTYAYKIVTTINTVSAKVKVKTLEYIAKTTPIVFSLQVTLPSTAGTYSTTNFTFYRDDTLAQLYQSFTLTPITVTSFSRLYNTGVLPILTPQVLLMANEIGPLRLTYKPTVAMTNNWDYVVIDQTYFVKHFEFPTTTTYEIRCFWNEMAAMMCFHDPVAKTIKVYRPSNTVIAAGTLYTIFVTQWRLKPLG